MVNIPWDGRERRKGSRDHDSLIEVIQILRLHVDNFEKHIEKDERQFQFLNRICFIGMGGLGMLQIIIGVFHK